MNNKNTQRNLSTNTTNKKGSPIFKKGSEHYDYGSEQDKLQTGIDTALADFKAVDTTQNLWEGAKNEYQDLQNPYEDITVNQQQAQFQKEMALQQQSNLMNAPGGQFNAQQASNQMAQSRQQISASIGQQEAANQAKAAEGNKWVQETKAKGAMDAQKIKLQGAADARDLTLQAKQGELAFISGQMGASKANEDADFRKGQNFWGTDRSSDRKLKKNINLIGKSLSGLNIYSFEYKNSIHGSGLFQGVMSDEIPQEAVTTVDGYDKVNYNMLDVEFKQL